MDKLKYRFAIQYEPKINFLRGKINEEPVKRAQKFIVSSIIDIFRVIFNKKAETTITTLLMQLVIKKADKKN